MRSQRPCAKWSAHDCFRSSLLPLLAVATAGDELVPSASLKGVGPLSGGGVEESSPTVDGEGALAVVAIAAAPCSSLISVSCLGRLTSRRWPARSSMSPPAIGPLTATLPCCSRSSKRSLRGSHAAVKDDPWTAIEKGPASIRQLRSSLRATLKEALPWSSTTHVPAVSSERRRPRAPGINSTLVPSLKNSRTPPFPESRRYPPASTLPPSMR